LNSKILTLFGKCSFDDIRSACGSDWRLIQDMISDNDVLNHSNVTDIAIKLYGTSILEAESFRELFLATIPSEELYELAKEYNLAVEPDLPALAAKLLAARPWSNASKLLKVFKNLGFDESYLPLESRRNKTTEDVSGFKGISELFDYQKNTVEEIIKKINKGDDRILVQLPTGSGKTRIMMESILKLVNSLDSKPSVLWLAHSEELLEQAISSFKNVWSSKASCSMRIHRFYGGYKPNDYLFSESMIFAGLQKISRLDPNSETFCSLSESLSIIIVDEAHKIAADTYERMMNSLLSKSNSILIGVTATPGRSYTISPENRLFAKFFNDNLVTPDLGENPIKTLQDMGVLSKVTRRVLDTNIIISDTKMNNSTLKKLGKLKERNTMLLNEIQKEVDLNRPTLVFSCSVQHSRLLTVGLAIKGIKAAFVDYTKSSSSRKLVIEKFKQGEIKVLINYGVLSTGFDAPEIQTLVIARPTTSLILYSQMIGRGLRGPKVGGNKEVTVIDVKDNFSAYGDLDVMYNHFSGYWR
jgi:superfamily II DNA or RNA helicase